VSIRSVIGVRRKPLAATMGKVAVALLRWVLGSSPAWYAALRRVDAKIPEGYWFRDQ
jgi:hypothetical protein